MAQQREAARQQQAASMDAHRQQELQQRVLASLSPQQLHQLRNMPRVLPARLASLYDAQCHPHIMLSVIIGLGTQAGWVRAFCAK